MREEKNPPPPPFKTYLCPFCRKNQRLLAVSWDLVYAQALIHFESCMRTEVHRSVATLRAASEVADALAPQKN